jgi:hypothetical protein
MLIRYELSLFLISGARLNFYSYLFIPFIKDKRKIWRINKRDFLSWTFHFHLTYLQADVKYGDINNTFNYVFEFRDIFTPHYWSTSVD